VSTRKPTLSEAEITQAFAEGSGAHFPPILTVEQVASLLQISPKTVYEWIGKGRLDGAFRKRGKHHLIWRDRVIDILFNGAEWPHEKRN
jgi:excisionase family DNA binding protein